MFSSWLVFHSDSRLVRETTKNICQSNKFRTSQRNNYLARSVYLAMLFFFFFFFFAFSRRADLFIYDFLVNY